MSKKIEKILKEKETLANCIEFLKKCNLNLSEDSIEFQEENMIILTKIGNSVSQIDLKKHSLSFLCGFVKATSIQKQIEL